MGVVTCEFEIATSFPPARLFKAFVLDGDNIIPKMVPQVVKGIEFLEGDGGPGSIKKITFGEGSQFNYVKHRVEALDKENFFFSYTVIEGDALINRLEKITSDIKFEAAAGGGSVCKSTSKYYPIGDIEIKEEEIKAGKERALGLYKALEAYLLANPDAYN